jgi:hypothetical protein
MPLVVIVLAVAVYVIAKYPDSPWVSWPSARFSGSLFYPGIPVALLAVLRRHRCLICGGCDKDACFSDCVVIAIPLLFG